VKPVILDTGPCLNFISIGEGNLMHAALAVDFDKLLVPREVANEIGDKSSEVPKFARADPLFKGLVRDSKIEILESDAHNDMALVKAIKLVSRLPPSALLTKRRKDLGETMVVAHAIKLREAGFEVTLVIDDGGGRGLAKAHGFAVIGTIRILGLAASKGLVPRAKMKGIYERLRPSNGAEPMDDGLPHWHDSGLGHRALYKTS
jgi:predicted nucleic acid-binding protein